MTASIVKPSVRASRRRFLRTAGLAGGALALFPWLKAAAAPSPPKIVFFFTPHGTVWDRWRPTGGETDFGFSHILQPLEAHRERLVICEGIEIKTGTDYYIPHTYTMPALWTGSPIDTSSTQFCRDDHMQCFGWNTGVSVDQTIAGRLANPGPFPTLDLGIGCGGLHPATRMIYSAAGMPRSPIDDPESAFNTLFGTIDPDAEAAAKDARRRKSVLDAAMGDFSSWKGKLSAADKARLDAHAESIRQLETSLTSTATCTPPDPPTGINSETAIDRQSELIASALGCGLTQVASMQVRIADNDNTLYPWLGIEAEGHHTLSHQNVADPQAKLADLYRWYSARIAHLLDRLAATPDSDGRSVLDNTLVIWGTELGQAWNHAIDNVPFVFAGATDRLRGGRYLDCGGVQHNRVLVTALHAMGMTDVESYGSLDDDIGPLSGVLNG